MLYDYLTYQNSIKENSIHATYLLYGQKKPLETQTDGDVEMGSSQPEQEDFSEPVVTETLTLVAEESLKGQPAEGPFITHQAATNTLQQFSTSTKRLPQSTSTVSLHTPRKTSPSSQTSHAPSQSTPQKKTPSRQGASTALSSTPTSGDVTAAERPSSQHRALPSLSKRRSQPLRLL